MLQVNAISFVQFRNYWQQSFVFTQKVVGICGPNGSGKTNLLDSIYYLGFTKSYFGKTDAQNVQHGVEGFRLQGEFQLDNEAFTITAIVRENQKKEFAVNGEEYKKMSLHIGKFPCVMIAPDDVALIIGGSEERRKFIDTLLSQLNSDYLQCLITYNKLLQQRNSLLKQAAEQGTLNDALMQVYDGQLATVGNAIYQYREVFLAELIPLVIDYYKKIAFTTDGLTIQYQSDVQKFEMLTLLQMSRSKDAILQRTSVGIHKDELMIKMGIAPFKSEASQGQRKSLLFALKLAEWQLLKNRKGFSPILLLDDVFEKLDEQRMYNLLQWVCTEKDSQVLITDTHIDRLQSQLTQIGITYQIIQLQ